jgi:nucleoside-diphosphate kinase
MIKPDAVQNGYAGDILNIIRDNGFRVVALKLRKIATYEAQVFYEVHRERPFYNSLVKFMSEGPVVVMVLEREHAIAKWRDVMGATNPANAAEGTIRKRFAESIERNAVHGSDGPETAAQEIPFFFSTVELL